MVLGGTLMGQAQVGALMILRGKQTQFDGQVRIGTVMNTLYDLLADGDLMLLGDIELHLCPPHGVCYGIIEPYMIADPHVGAERREPAPEVPRCWP